MNIACRDGEQRSAVLQQYFIAQRWGKSCWTCVALFPKMTRRAFPGSRVIRSSGKSCFWKAVKNMGFLDRKHDIFQNSWIRLTRDHFSYIHQVTTCPGIHPLCPSMRFRKSYTRGMIFHDTEIFEKNVSFTSEVHFYRSTGVDQSRIRSSCPARVDWESSGRRWIVEPF